ncbi:hypothetical protein LshimejAT787_0900270 [Lyophyllum shimeji]|uniref:Uncharacterized protein n=1 Tax=Lyophyllum shimeji TaxID=47721 RepID=A0A9P3UQ13_LYOSH|nr:hypothetical protein LshimejAT787_0900270 [Lyophyllum shimeji]
MSPDIILVDSTGAPAPPVPSSALWFGHAWCHTPFHTLTQLHDTATSLTLFRGKDLARKKACGLPFEEHSQRDGSEAGESSTVAQRGEGSVQLVFLRHENLVDLPDFHATAADPGGAETICTEVAGCSHAAPRSEVAAWIREARDDVPYHTRRSSDDAAALMTSHAVLASTSS